MRNLKVLLLLSIMCALPVSAASKQKGSTTLKDFQPAGTTDKNNKNQQYDMTFVVSGNEYTCRAKDKLKATDFVVGTEIAYEIDNYKAKVKSSTGKQTSCTVVRVEKLPATPN